TGDENIGRSVSLNLDGTRLAIGANVADDNGTDSGRVEVYDWDGTAWSQVGSSIVGELAGANAGFSVSLSHDGRRIVVGENLNSDNHSNEGLVRIYEYDGSNWQLLSLGIEGEAAGDKFGVSVAISGDGRYIAAGAHQNDGTGANAGHVRVYELGTSSAALPVEYTEADGAVIVYSDFYITDIDNANLASAEIEISANYVNGEDTLSFTSQHGITGSFNTTTGILSLSGSATKAQYEEVLASVTYENSSSTPTESTRTISFKVNDGSFDSNTATVTVEVSGIDNAPDLSFVGFEQLGNDIDGEAASDQSGWSVATNEDGSIIAVGAKNNDGTGSNAGHVRLYQYNGTTWNQLGSDIDGELAADESGYSIDLSQDGLTVAIGAPQNDGNGGASGHVRVYDYVGTDWVQRGVDLDGE
ncbi:FG-GAP repeat protein, partial [Thiotrichales bacterium 19S11-10]|nr:FG-GAP repeat protein [Thiotrichales bacterium 19S11-10]